MSGAYQGGLNYLYSYPGVLKLCEGGLHIAIIVLTALLGPSAQAKVLCGMSIYGLVSVIVFFAYHVRGMPLKDTNFPWYWVEFANCAILALLLFGTSVAVILVLTKGHIITGIIAFIAVMVYSLDAVEKFSIAKTPRAQYVWTTPNMPE